MSDTVTFRPDSRDGSKDYQIPRAVAEDLWHRGEIFGDATNGGYMPNEASRYNVRQHMVLPAQKAKPAPRPPIQKPPSMTKHRLGQRVELLSGSPVMTIVAVTHDEKRVKVAWFAPVDIRVQGRPIYDVNVREAWFPVEALALG